MSYFQPLITTAFSNYGLLRSSYVYRDSDITVGSVTGKQVNDSNKINEESKLQKNNSTNDSDSGKVKSAFGDVLDISDEGKIAFELLSGNSKADSNSSSKVVSEETDQGDSKASSSVETKDTKIKVENSSANKSDRVSSAKEEAEVQIQNSETSQELTKEEQEQVSELKERDAEVRQHEAAHLAVAGQYAQGGAQYTYQTGPDGKKYAIGGSVSIDVSEVEGDPEATIAKMQQVAAAATAPAEPSSQDLKVAAAARRTEAKARIELAQSNAENAMNTGNQSDESEESEESENSGNIFSQSVKNSVQSKNSSNQAVAINVAKSVVSSAYASTSTLSSNATFVNRVNIYV
ncbi:MAG: hypothetical protein LBE18_11630 [Planctomycetaceae bacterium]|jgi:hypothetical protein|nr:hypothetical protein [Planctomycetaceae bacterium]